MSETNATCPECGTELPAGTPASRCPHCLIGLGLAEEGRSQKAEDSGQKPDSSPGTDSTLRTPHSALRKEFGDYELIEEIARGGGGGGDGGVGQGAARNEAARNSVLWVAIRSRAYRTFQVHNVENSAAEVCRVS